MGTVFEHPSELLRAIGRSLGHSDWFLVENARVDQFATATGHTLTANHVPEYLTLSLVNFFLPQLVDVRGISMGVNVGCENVRFPAQLRVGTCIRGRGELIDVREEKGGIQATIRVTVEHDGGDTPACVVDTISRYYPA